LTITANNDSKTYGQTFSVGSGSTAFTSSGLQNSETIGSITIASSGVVNTAITGSYAIVPSAATGGSFTTSNYTILYTDGTLTVNTAPLTINGITANNKAYDGNTTATLSGTPAYVGLQNGESFAVTGTPSASFVSASVGTGKTVTISGYTAPSSNYTVSQPTLTADITTAPLTITGVAANNKTYDGLTSAALSGTAAYVGLQNGESFSVTGTPLANFVTAAVGNGKTVTVTGYTTPSSNYTLTQPSLTADITTAILTITGVTANNKTYDGLTTATLAGTPAYAGLENGETFSVTGIPTASFASATVGTGKTVTVTGYTAPSSNYTLTQPSLTGNITAAPLTIIGVTADNKIYDGNTVATLSGTPAYVGLQNGESFSVTGTPSASFATAAVGSGKAVTVIGYTAPSANYTVSQPTGLTANITALALTVSGATTTNKVYDGTTTATITGGVLVGVVGADVVNLTLSGTFSDKNVGTSKTITSTCTISGANAGNYTLTQPTLTARDITPKTLSITAPTIASKVYNGLAASGTVTVGTLSGFIGTETVTTTATGLYSDANVGTGKSATVTYTLVNGTNGGLATNYSLANGTATGNITAAALTITGVTANNKTYDGTTTATLSGTATYVGLQNGESYSVTGTPSSSFATAAVGTGKALTVTGYNAPSANYTVSQPTGLTANITALALTISGATTTNKVYDGTTTATITGGSLVGVVGAVTLTQSGTFSDKNVGTSKTITSTCTISGANAGNYTLIQPSLTPRDITPKALSITAPTIASKVYNGIAASGTVTVGTLSGFIGAETVTTTATGLYSDANVGTGKSATVTYTLVNGTNGGLATNYSLANESATGNITAAPLTITGVTANNKTYDGNTVATLSGTAAYSGLQNGESFNVTGTPSASFATAIVGNAKPVTVTGYTAPSANYTVSQPTGLTANITPATITVTATLQLKPYGSTAPTSGTLNTNFTVSGLIGTDTANTTTLGYSGSPAGNLTTAIVGTYDITPSALTLLSGSLSNYSITYATGTLTVTTTTFNAGVYIIDMGQPQTINSGLKPYGLVYELIKAGIPINWAINPVKAKDGIDFSATTAAKGTIPYSGGCFIIDTSIPSTLSTTAITIINKWKTDYPGLVVDGPTTQPFTAPLYKTQPIWPKAFLDAANDTKITPYYTNAGIPSNSYQINTDPTYLPQCGSSSGTQDVYILPHADPQDWSADWISYLTNFINNGGAMWAGCHAVSAMENIAGCNFLSSTGLVSWTNHDSNAASKEGTPPYTYADHGNPIMQFIGTFDGATTNGSEEIYLPKTSWLPTTTVAVYDPTYTNFDPNPDVNYSLPDAASTVVYGPAYGTKGLIMYEAGHSLENGTVAEEVAAQRAFFNYLLLVGSQPQNSLSPPNVGTQTITAATCNSVPFTVTPINDARVTYTWTTPTGTGFTGGAAETVGQSSISQTLTNTTAGNVTATYTVTPAIGRCVGTPFTLVVTIYPPVSMTATASASPICLGSSSTLTASGASSYNWSPATGLSSTTGTSVTATPTVTTTYTVSETGVNANGCVNSKSITVVVNTSNVTLGASPNPLCVGSTLNLTSSNVFASPTLLSESFNGATNSWTTINTSTGGTPANATWTLRPHQYPIDCSGDTSKLESNDNSQFYLANSCEQGSGGTTQTILQSPVMSTVAYSSLSLNFYQYFKFYTGATAKVEVSTNGSTWTTVATYSSTQGTKTTFDQEIISLNSYIGNSTFYIRFKYDGPYSWYWAIDNVTVSGNVTPSPISWTGPNGFTSNIQNPTILNVTAASAGNYTLTYNDPVSGCVASTQTIPVNVNSLPTISVAPATPAICIGGSTTLTASGAVTYSWSPATGLSATAGETVTANPVTTTTYTVTGTNANGCINTTVVEVVVNSLPTISITPSSATNCGSNGSLLTASGATTYSWSPATGLSATTGAAVTASPAATTTYTVTGTNANGCINTDTVTVTVIPTPVTAGVTICPGDTGTLTSSSTCPEGNSITVGPRNPVAATSAGGGTIVWSNPTNALTINSVYTTANLSGPGLKSSQYLRTTNYDFSAIPSNATIVGISVTIGRFQNSTGGGNDVKDFDVNLLKAGTIVGNDYANTGTEWPTTLTAANYGGTLDLWGTTWTVNDIKNTGFGATLQVNSDNDRTASVDYMQIAVTYTLPGILNWYTVASGGTAIGTGSPFNPVGVANSGLANTNTPGTYTFYAECSSDTRCRTATNFIINPNASIASVTGTSPLCIGSTDTYSANSVVLGGSGTGAWSSDNTAVATVNASTGVVTAVAAGTANIIYTITGGCGGTTSKQQSVTVNPNASIASVTGTSPLCITSTATYTANTVVLGGGTGAWNSSNPAIASVNASTGVVTGVAAGTTTITYTITGGCSGTKSAFQSVTITPSVNINPFSPTTSTRCQAAETVTTTTTASNNSAAIVYSLDATTAAFSGNSINSSTGAVTYAAGWSGTTTITASAAGCNGPAITTHVVTVNALPVITTQPINQLDCEGSIVSFNVVASGTGLTYVWQRKLTTDAGFSTIPVEANVSYPTPDKIRLQNVGSSLSPDGTQYRVIVTSSGCSVTSTPATLSVNEITGISPISTNVTQCYGTNYSYTVSTSYPANVVTYQWKSSIASGPWNDVVDGVHFSGAQTASLNIINGTPAESAEYRVYITFTSSGANCNVDSASRTRRITFLPLLTTPVATITQPTCGTATGTITVTVQSASDTYSFDNGNTYQASNVKSGLVAGNYNVIIKNSLDCVSATTATVINSQPVTPVQPTLSAATLPTCLVPTGSFTINNYNASYVYAVTPNTGVAVSGNTITASAGSYSVIATLGTCSSIASSSVTISPLVTNTWSNAAWSAGSAPTMNTLVVINSDYNTSTNGNLIACSVIINAGKKLTITPDYYATIQNDLTVNGTLEVLDKGSLVMINDSGTVTNNGISKVHRFTSLFEKYDYVYWSTPVASTNIASTFPTWRTNYAFEFLPANFADANGDGFDDNGDDWSYASTMVPGKGYIIMTPTNKTIYPSVEEAVFSGKVNNGVVTTPIALTPNAATHDDFNLVGNPYPSAISANAFINSNISTNGGTIDGTLYFWTHVGDISSANVGPDGLNYSPNDYAVYNLSGGVQAGLGGAIPSGFIGSGQGFFVEADRVGTLLFNNAMRVGTETKNNQFYKLRSNSKKSTTNVKDRLWLNLENSSKMFSQQLIGYFDNATLGYDKGYDGLFSDAGNYINFYSFIENDTYKIQGRATFNQNDQIRLGYFSAISGTFNINIGSKEGVFANVNQAIYLEDKVSNTIFDLKIGSYTFTTAKGTFNDRFVLRFTDKTLGTADVEKPEGQVLIFLQNQQLKINSFAETIDKVVVYDLSGKQRYQKRKVNSNEVLLTTLAPSHQILLVKTVLHNGKSSTQKVLF
jgi:hypothetical protein